MAVRIYCGDRLVWAVRSPQCFLCQRCGKRVKVAW